MAEGALSGRTAWITGAGTGIGRATARAFAAAGARVALSGRRPGPVEAVAAEIAAGGSSALALPADLSDPASVAAARDAVLAAFDALDVLVNNAGVNLTGRAWHQLTPEAIRLMIDGNLVGPTLCVAAVLPHMRKRRSGTIVNVASWAGRFVGSVSGPIYTAAKHGMVAMSQSINVEECIHGIRATAVCPGEVDTPILDLRPRQLPPEVRARLLEPADVAAAILFAASQPARVCVNEILVSPVWNRGFVAQARTVHGLR